MLNKCSRITFHVLVKIRSIRSQKTQGNIYYFICKFSKNILSTYLQECVHILIQHKHLQKREFLVKGEAQLDSASLASQSANLSGKGLMSISKDKTRQKLLAVPKRLADC